MGVEVPPDLEEMPNWHSMAARRSRTPSRTPQRGFNCSDIFLLREVVVVVGSLGVNK